MDELAEQEKPKDEIRWGVLFLVTASVLGFLAFALFAPALAMFLLGGAICIAGIITVIVMLYLHIVEDDHPGGYD